MYRRDTTGIVINSPLLYFLFAFDFPFVIFCMSIYEFLRGLPRWNFFSALRVAYKVDLSFGLSAEFCKVQIPDCGLSLAWIFDYRGLVIGFVTYYTDANTSYSPSKPWIFLIWASIWPFQTSMMSLFLELAIRYVDGA